MNDDDIQDRPEPRRRRDRDDDDDDRPRRRNRDDDYDDDPSDIRADAPFPGGVLTAGIIWIIMGALILIGAAIILIPAVMAVSAGVGALGVPFMCGSAFVALFGGAFLFVGIQSVKGTANDTLGNAIGSMIFAVLILGFAFLNFSSGSTLSGVVGLLEGAGLILAGVLALMGRDDYKRWKRSRRRRRD